MPGGRPSRETVYERLDDHVAELWQRMSGLPNRVEALLAEGRAVGDKELREYMEVRGYASAADWVYGQAIEPKTWSPDEYVTLTELRHVHELAMTPVWDVAPHPDATPQERPGAFRRHDIQPFPGGMTPPPWTEVPSLIASWLEEVNGIPPRTSEFPEAIARVHCSFERIHPFLDGNGRAGRLTLNLLLVRLGYPPAIIYKNQRQAYLRALRRADQGDTGALGELLARAILDTLYRFVMPAVAGPARLVPLAALARDSVSATALRSAAIRGRLQATRGGDGQWRSTRNWVDEYYKSRYDRG